MRGKNVAHAESPASPMMNAALVTTRDGITGHWDGTPSMVPTPIPDDDAYLDMLGLSGQASVLESALCSVVSVGEAEGQAEGQAEVRIAGQPVARLAKPDADYFAHDLAWVRAYADLRGERIEEIHLQLDDLLSFFGSLGYLGPSRRSHTMLMLDMARRLAIHVEVTMKFICRAARPIDLAIEVQPMIQTPDHSSYPSGHAMEAFAIATVLHRLQTGQGPLEGIRNGALPFRLAHRIAVNRTVAGVHFPVDSHAGASVGCLVGDALHSLAHGVPLPCGDIGLPARDDGGATQDFLLPLLEDLPQDRELTPEVIGVANTLWSKAAAEWPALDTGPGDDGDDGEAET
ncbi:phosphatase PAP2 family protein [Marinibacterium profundimaris]|uniref:phosphatase PAP2 family protein n=1 Tax=Marinibacterium profundimaris TaxID=1679460 RepID=UPI0018E94E78|nr:phosphatase PAP2 family protein [Marinibacterium profundimaris]